MRRALFSLLLLFMSTLTAFTQTAATVTRPSQSLEWAAFLGPFPAVTSDEGKADLAIVLWQQRTRTPTDIQRALAGVKLPLDLYAPAAAKPLSAVNYPKTAALVDRAWKGLRVVTSDLKTHFQRPRPFLGDARVQPVLDRDASPSYPSGHATCGLAYGMVLAELAPERREALLIQGRQVGFDRVIGGVHYPSDVEAGQRLAHRYITVWLADPQNKSEVEAVRVAEWPASAKP